jgi:hypothetical protein
MCSLLSTSLIPRNKASFPPEIPRRLSSAGTLVPIQSAAKSYVTLSRSLNLTCPVDITFPIHIPGL